MRAILTMMKSVFLSILAVCWMTGCEDDNKDTIVSEGNYTNSMIQKLKGFGEEKAALLRECDLSESLFISLSTDSAWGLPEDKQVLLKRVRDRVSKPDGQTLLQKVIPLEEISTYMNNKYGGTIGGFVSEAADVKNLATMHDVYWGLRLDYTGTKFSETGAGYAIIRFYSSMASHLSVPYAKELDEESTQENNWPFGGGGFTTSTLGEGGYPEWITNGYYAPDEGAELYEVTPQGREILRSVFLDGRWQTFESEYYPVPQARGASTIFRNGAYNDQFVTTFGTYAGYSFIVRAEIDGFCHLTTRQAYPISGLEVVEKGIYGIEVPVNEVSNIHEEVASIR